LPPKRNRWIIFLGIAALLVALFLGERYLTQKDVRLFALDSETGRVRWSRPVQLDWNFAPAAGNGQVLAYSQVPLTAQERASAHTKRENTVKLCAFEASTGRQLWEYVVDPKQFKYSDNSVLGTPPFIDGNRIVATVNEETLAVLNGDSGVLQWSRADAVSMANDRAFTFAGDRFIMVAFKGDPKDLSLVALDAKSGAPIWETDSPGIGVFSVTLDRPAIVTNDRTVFVSSALTVKAFDLQSGASQFNIAADSRQLQVLGDTLFIGTIDSVLAVDAATGAPRWTFLPTAPPEAEPYLFEMKTVGQVTYIVNSSWGEDQKDGAWLFALDARDGHELWRRQLIHAASRSQAWTQFLFASPAVNQDVIVITLEDENRDTVTRAFSAVDGSELWHFSLYQRGDHAAPASPALDGKFVFLTDYAPRWLLWLKALNLAWNN
jgi:outer membrane protein assembly factor BamB